MCENIPVTIDKLTYRRGMLENLNDESHLKESILIGTALPSEILESITKDKLLSAGGSYGDKWVGDPIQYDYLEIEHANGTTEITVYNRAIMLFTTDEDIYKRIHRLCCKLDDLTSP